ncbi:hypothetical protein [Niveibacterium terrae]|uniref:hypothetical protein n=1 Tax=Niveibacterium terrae TaxID=3373598 RepID=UPI003A911D1F
MGKSDTEIGWDEHKPYPWLVFRVVLAAALVVLGVCLGGAMGILTVLPLVALCIAVPLTHALFALFDDLRHSAFRGWSGSWYEFEGIQIRVIEETSCTWVSLADLLRGLGEAHRGRALRGRLAAIPEGQWRCYEGIGACLSQQAVRDVLAAYCSSDARRLSCWFERDVLFAHERRRGRRQGEAAL